MASKLPYRGYFLHADDHHSLAWPWIKQALKGYFNRSFPVVVFAYLIHVFWAAIISTDGVEFVLRLILGFILLIHLWWVYIGWPISKAVMFYLVWGRLRYDQPRLVLMLGKTCMIYRIPSKRPDVPVFDPYEVKP